MRNVLWHYYEIRYENSLTLKDGFLLVTQESEFLFKELKVPLDNLKLIAETLYLHQIPSYLLVINKKGDILTDFNDKKYILLKKIPLSTDNLDLTFIELKNDLNDIGSIWSRKIDYYMIQIKELGLAKELLINSFNYYVGMAENAISMANRINEKNTTFKYVIQHTRIKYPISKESYYDPTTMVIDIRIRDIAEFIKDKFMQDHIDMSEVERITSKYNLTSEEMNMLYARLFFPTYYFDLFEDIILGEKEEDNILPIIEKYKNYESFLESFYRAFNQKYNLFEIEWIKKEPYI